MNNFLSEVPKLFQKPNGEVDEELVEQCKEYFEWQYLLAPMYISKEEANTMLNLLIQLYKINKMISGG